MPQAHPEPVVRHASFRQFQPVVDPRIGVLHAAVFAQRSIHPCERYEFQRVENLPLIVPARDGVAHPEAEPVAVGEAHGRIVVETGLRHGAMGRRWANPEEVLPRSAYLPAGHSSNP